METGSEAKVWRLGMRLRFGNEAKVWRLGTRLRCGNWKRG